MNLTLDIDKLRKNLHNHTEDLVLENLKDIIVNDYNHICSCEQCLLDIASFVLSRLPAKYISSSAGNLHTKIAEFEQQYQVDIMTLLTRGIKIVNENPSKSCKKLKDNP